MLIYNYRKGKQLLKEENKMTGRTTKQRIYRGWKIEQKVSCKYRFTITNGSKVIRTNEPKNIIEAMDFVDNMLDK
jgi:hypothetical protein